MISIAGALFLVVGFVVLMKVFGLVEKSRKVVSIAGKAASDLRNPEFDDEHKEKALQGYAKSLFQLFFLLLVGGILALGIPVLLIYLMDQTGWLSIDGVIEASLRWEFLAIVTAVAFIIIWIKGKL